MLKGWGKPTIVLIAFSALVAVASWWGVKTTIEQRLEVMTNALYWAEPNTNQASMLVCLGNLKTVEMLMSSWSGTVWVLRDDKLRTRVRLLLNHNTGFDGEQFVDCGPS